MSYVEVVRRWPTCAICNLSIDDDDAWDLDHLHVTPMPITTGGNKRSDYGPARGRLHSECHRLVTTVEAGLRGTSLPKFAGKIAVWGKKTFHNAVRYIETDGRMK